MLEGAGLTSRSTWAKDVPGGVSRGLGLPPSASGRPARCLRLQPFQPDRRAAPGLRGRHLPACGRQCGQPGRPPDLVIRDLRGNVNTRLAKLTLATTTPSSPPPRRPETAGWPIASPPSSS